jgi:hypothetical protein
MLNKYHVAWSQSLSGSNLNVHTDVYGNTSFPDIFSLLMTNDLVYNCPSVRIF